MPPFFRFADPILDTPLVPEDFAAVSRFCAADMNPAMSAAGTVTVAVPIFDSLFSFADHPAEGSGQLQFENI